MRNDRVSEEVRNAVRGLYARLATVAAKKAVEQVNYGSLIAAEESVLKVEEWLIQAGAQATRWTYRQPNV